MKMEHITKEQAAESIKKMFKLKAKVRIYRKNDKQIMMGEQPLKIKPCMFYIKPIGAPDSELKELKIASSKDIHFDVGAPEGDFSAISMPMEFKFEGTLKLSEHKQKVWAYMMKGPTPWLIYAKRYPRKLKKHYKRIIEASVGNKVVFKYASKHYYL